jgi:hypothetical protein
MPTQNSCAAAINCKSKEKPGLDWWGVNYYARGAITGWGLPAHAPGELMTDMKVGQFMTGHDTAWYSHYVFYEFCM